MQGLFFRSFSGEARTACPQPGIRSNRQAGCDTRMTISLVPCSNAFCFRDRTASNFNASNFHASVCRHLFWLVKSHPSPNVRIYCHIYHIYYRIYHHRVANSGPYHLQSWETGRPLIYRFSRCSLEVLLSHSP